MNPQNWLETELNRVWPWLEASLAKQPIATHEKHHVLESLVAGTSHLWVTPNSATITELTTYPNGTRVLFAWLAGGSLSELKQTAAMLEALAAQTACAAFAMVVMRDGFSRAFSGYEKAGMTLVKDLR